MMTAVVKQTRLKRWCGTCQRATLSWLDDQSVERCAGHEKRDRKKLKTLGEIEDAKREGTLR